MHHDAEVAIEEMTEVTDELVEAWQRLLPMVSGSAPLLTRADLTDIVESEVTTLFMARVGQAYAGSLTLVMFRIPDGVRAWIEDVVVDEAYRGQGLGERLSRVAVERATTAGVRSIDLTSNPKREAANKLYQKIGFEIRETNYYRYLPKERSA